MAVMDRGTLSSLTNSPLYSNSTTYSNAYLAGIFQAVQDEITTLLRWNPILHVVENEEGLVRYITDGVYAGRYMAELKGKPLIPGDGPTVFQNLQLTYALAFSGPTNVSLSLVQMQHNNGILFCLGPGMVEALAGITFSFAAPKPAVYATNYSAGYVAGYSTGIADIVPNGGGTGFAAHAVLNASGGLQNIIVDTPGTGFTSPPILTITGGSGNGATAYAILSGSSIGSVVVSGAGQSYVSAPTIGVSAATTFNAPLMPADIQQAILLLIRERISFEDEMNSNPQYARSGGMMSEFTQGKRSEKYIPTSLNEPPTNLGYGGFLSQLAARKLQRYVKRRVPDFQ